MQDSRDGQNDTITGPVSAENTGYWEESSCSLEAREAVDRRWLVDNTEALALKSIGVTSSQAL